MPRVAAMNPAPKHTVAEVAAHWRHPDIASLRAEAKRIGVAMDAATGREKAALRQRHRTALNAIRDRIQTLKETGQ